MTHKLDNNVLCGFAFDADFQVEKTVGEAVSIRVVVSSSILSIRETCRESFNFGISPCNYSQAIFDVQADAF